MKFVLACWGSRGDIEPVAVVGRELQRRGHEVCMAVPPDQIAFVEKLGLAAVAYGVDWSESMKLMRSFLSLLLPPPLENPGSDQVRARTMGGLYPVLGRHEHDAHVGWRTAPTCY